MLLASGAPINEINTLRKHFSAVKGGRLAMAAPEAPKVSLLVPDVPLRTLDALSSGPTSPDHSTVADVRELLAKYDLAANCRPRSARSLSAKTCPSRPATKAGVLRSFPKCPGPMPRRPRRMTSAASMSGEDQPFAIRSSRFCSPATTWWRTRAHLAQQAGYHVVVDNSCDDWDYADAARYLLERFHTLRAQHKRFCLISVGEVTVTLNRTPGAGGRNQQFALACALELANHPGEHLTVLSAGSDGIDGNTQAAGAIADPTTVARARAFGFDPEQSLAEFNACPLFTALGDSVVTGPTGHNLRDLRLLIVRKRLERRAAIHLALNSQVENRTIFPPAFHLAALGLVRGSKIKSQDRRQTPDIRTVAAVAKVSIATVSRTINGSPLVSERLSKRVWQAIKQLNYFPNTHARTLVSGRSRIARHHRRKHHQSVLP